MFSRSKIAEVVRARRGIPPLEKDESDGKDYNMVSSFLRKVYFNSREISKV